MTKPPNLKTVNCCHNCKHGNYDYDDWITCDKHENDIDMDRDTICDDWEIEK